MSWLIYGYKIKETQEVKYVGQTNNLSYRRYRHETYDPFTKNIREYDYPLSRGIRKHGFNYYELFIIEDHIEDAEIAIEREKYWIAYYDTYNHGYNQTPGGKAPKYIKFSPEVIAYAKECIKNKIPFQQISSETGISIVHLSEINTGKRHHDDNENYPLNKMTQGRKLTDEDVEKIIFLLQNTKLSQSKIGQQFNIAQTVISCINLGKIHKNSNLSYPIRK